MLTAVVTDINTVDEAHRSFYAEKDGKFFLQVKPVDGYELDNVSGLKTALGAERATVSTLKGQLKPFEGLDPASVRIAVERANAFGDLTPEKAKEALETAERLSAFNPEKEADRLAEEKVKTATAQLQGQFVQKETALTQQVQTLNSTVDALKGQLREVTVDAVVRSELAKLNPLDDARDAIELLAEKYIKTIEKDGKIEVVVVDEAGNPRIKDAAMTPFTVADFMAEMRTKRPGLFKADQIAGIGANPGAAQAAANGVVNPWSKDGWNFTQQGILENTKPELAKQLKAAAGVKD